MVRDFYLLQQSSCGVGMGGGWHSEGETAEFLKLGFGVSGEA